MGFTAQTFLFIFLPLSIVAYLLCTRLHRPLLNNILLALMSLAFYARINKTTIAPLYH